MKASGKMMVFVVVCALAAGAAYAKFVNPEDAIKYRKSAMFILAQHFKRMGAVVQGKMDYDKQTFAANAEVVKVLATLPWEAALESGTDKGDTTMSSAVFSKKTEFEETARTFEEATDRLATASQGADFDTIKSEFGAVAKSCKECHTAFRTK